jgi:hypothetical protein
MQINEFLKLLKLNYSKILLFSVFGLIIGFVTYLILPNKYVSEGTLYIYPVGKTEQRSEISNELNYARNIIGLSETPEFKLNLKNKEVIELDYIPLIGVSYGVKIKEVTPNLVSITVSGYSIENSEHKFSSYLENILYFKEKLNQGNSSFEISKLHDKIISYKVEKNLFLYSFVGVFLGFNCGLIYLYLRKKKK